MEKLQLHNKTYSMVLQMHSLGLALVLLVFCLPSPASSCTEQEKDSLLQFLAELSQDGGLSTSWRNGTDCCEWEGVLCRQDRTVIDVSLRSKGLEGRISQSLGTLAGLQYLDLSHNLLSGGLPLELLSSSSIVILDVSFNQLNGTLHDLPSSTPARPLQVLNISSNLFAGQFPSAAWKAMENLVALNASNNSLSGTLPDELFNATLLEYLSLANNDLHGVLDTANIVNLRNLVALDLSGNQFSGKIPDYIGQLKRLEVIHLNNNMMSGELPYALSYCTNLKKIDLKNNNFSGVLF